MTKPPRSGPSAKGKKVATTPISTSRRGHSGAGSSLQSVLTPEDRNVLYGLLVFAGSCSRACFDRLSMRVLALPRFGQESPTNRSAAAGRTYLQSGACHFPLSQGLPLRLQGLVQVEKPDARPQICLEILPLRPEAINQDEPPACATFLNKQVVEVHIVHGQAVGNCDLEEVDDQRSAFSL